MEELNKIYEAAREFRNERASLAMALTGVDVEYRRKLQELEHGHAAGAARMEEACRADCAAAVSKAEREMSVYAGKRAALQSVLQPVRSLCPVEQTRAYRPNPALAGEEEVSRLVQMVQEQGLAVWLKRVFHVGGYAPKTEMALSLYEKVEDACAYCGRRMEEAQAACDQAKRERTAKARRELQAAEEDFASRRRELEGRYQAKRAGALEALRAFDGNGALEALRRRVETMSLEAERACGSWGEYAAPRRMPERVKLCDVGLDLPDGGGADRRVRLPLELNLFSSSIVVLTGSGTAAGTDCLEKQLIRGFLARMLKTVPPGYCCYSVFDTLYKGASLERLIDVINIGSTELNFDLFTENNSDARGVCCTERRRYLCERPSDIIKFIAGRSRSLFEYNRREDSFDFPFTWIVDFNVPEEPDARMREDLKELFVNAEAAGYSFLLVTSPKGFETLRELARLYTDVPVLRVDCDQMSCTQWRRNGAVTGPFPLLDSGGPSSEQIGGFVTALKGFYEEGGSTDNKIDSVFASHGIALRDASRKLTVPMALDSLGRLVDVEFGGEGSVHGFVCGGTNCGKSTLLHTMILSACLHYRPDDLEIWLIDYKQTEFHLYKRQTPPHVKLIGVSKTPEFTFSLLDKIEEEANRRTALMNRFDAQNLAEYRAHKGEPGYENLTRLFLVIDEFHEMSQFVASEMEYRDKLENILREYRAQGITCLLADQAFSTGLSGLTQAAKNQIGLRIAMRNEVAPQEIQNTLEVDKALYSDSMQRTISMMSQGEFIMKVYVRNARGDLTDIRLEKFRALLSMGADIRPVSRALQLVYKGLYDQEDLIYVNTKEQVPWNDGDPAALDRLEPPRGSGLRLYLGRSAVLRPCFGLDLGRKPDENLSVVGGTVRQRWELLAAVMRSCAYRNCRLWVFLAEDSDWLHVCGQEIRDLCAAAPGGELLETEARWCEKLRELEGVLENTGETEDGVCMFIGLEYAWERFRNMRDRSDSGGAHGFSDILRRYAVPGTEDAPPPAPPPETFNALPLIERLFSSGARRGLRCVVEASVYRQFSKMLKIKDMCRHKVAFSMSADDCLMYLGSSRHQAGIGRYAVYSDGGKEVQKLLPYRLET